MKNLSFKRYLPGILLFTGIFTASAQQYQLNSPNGKLLLTVNAEQNLNWQIEHDGTTVLQPSAIALEGKDEKGKTLIHMGNDIKVINESRKSVNTSFQTPFYKKAEVKDIYNQLILKCRGGYSIEFRAYDNGAAYRLISEIRKPYRVTSETAEFNFDKDYKALVPYVNDQRSGERYCFSFESFYTPVRLSEMPDDSLSINPLMVELENGKKAVIMDAGVENYPGMFLSVNTQNRQGVQAKFAPYPLKETIGGYNCLNLIPTRRADYIARIENHFSLPWRVVLVTDKDTQLLDNDIAQCLAPECRITDTSWIKPGKSAWEWWNACNLTGFSFKSGINTATYKAYIDFAAANRLEYIIIDEGWSGNESLTQDLNPDIDLKELIAYSNANNVGIILWSSWRNAMKDTEKNFAYYEAMGIKGFKIDFFDRDDQPLMKSVYDIAACAARHKLVLDLHGLRPTGVQRAYPNILNFEGVKGLENAKWEPIINGAPLNDFPRYAVTAPYLRMLVGPMDYTPGAMMNASRSEFRTSNDRPMSMGTRVHQMAMYTIFEAPLQMLADSPSRYMKEKECTDFIAQVPTTFDETIALTGTVGEYIVLARRKGNVWYVAAMTNWTPRNYTLDFSFLGKGSYQAEIFADGINADREATDYKKTVRTISASDKLEIQMASGGGWTARITAR